MKHATEDAAAMLADAHAAPTTDDDGRFTVTELMDHYDRQDQHHSRKWVIERVRSLLRDGRVGRCTKTVFSELKGCHTAVPAYRARPEEPK